jgi:protein disulfide-isomerase A6
VIAKVDADSPNGKASAQKYGVSGFPTLKFFPKGSTDPVDYTSGRNEAAFVEFLNKNAGTFRLPGGGLNSEAGVIAEFDEIVKKLVPSDMAQLQIITDNIMKRAITAKDQTSALVYVKVLEKLATNPDYVKKEIERLQKILSKGGLLPEKVDQFTIKKNILSSFSSGDKAEEKSEEKVEGKDEL